MEWVEAIFEVLQWMGIDWDEEVVYQSKRVNQHRARAKSLVEKGKAYRCYYLPEELEAKKREALEDGRYWRNDRRYAEISASEAKALEAEGRQPVIRLKIPEGKTLFEDQILGEIEVKNETIDDFVIVRSNGTPLYHLAVVVDDIDMEVSHVIRGIDHLTNTTKHIQLFQALDATLPKFGHLPSILGEDKKKLSKRHGAVSVTEYRDAGYLSDAVINFLSLLGWQTGDDQEYFTRNELMNRFSLEQVHKRDTVFDLRKFEWLNGQHIMARSDEELWSLAQPFLKRDGLTNNPKTLDQHYSLGVIALLKERCRTLADFGEQGRFFFTDDLTYDPKAVRKHWSKEPEVVMQRLKWLRDDFILLELFDADTVERVIRKLSDNHGLKIAQFIHPSRVALTGSMTGPSLFHLIALLGRNTCINRLEKALARLPNIVEESVVDE